VLKTFTFSDKNGIKPMASTRIVTPVSQVLKEFDVTFAMSYPVTSLTCIMTLPAETSITFNCTAPISSSEIPFSLATPRRCSIQG
jgi:hypothetical protein